ncbi:MAG: hypothetical protein KC414_12725, partial [Romboutsia sp.]|nr:hypothetical protein [Romboutsia sp.]
KTKSQNSAWQLDLISNKEKPAAHNDGTTIKVKNLFYNTPGRRKFLRSEKTEYNHLEDLFKHIALSNFNVSLTLYNNGKVVKKLPKADSISTKNNRLAKLCGKKMVDASLLVNIEQNGLKLTGWLGLPSDSRSQIEHQYFYINGRAVKDKLINHAIKQAYQEYLENGKHPNFCLYLSIEPTELDVNVHPTKHEVRFRDSRTVHAFLEQNIFTTLSEYANTSQHKAYSEYTNNCQLVSGNINEQHSKTHDRISGHIDYNKLVGIDKLASKNNMDRDNTNINNGQKVYNELPQNTSITKCKNINNNTKDKVHQKNIKILSILDNQLALAQYQQTIIFINITASYKQLIKIEIHDYLNNNKPIPSKRLLMPENIMITNNLNKLLAKHETFKNLGFHFDQIGDNQILVRQ